jgi:hypothetical protein
MPAAEVTDILKSLVQEGGDRLEHRTSLETRTVVEEMRDLVVDRLQEDAVYAGLWEEFRSDPDDAEAEFTGALEALLEADPGLAKRLRSFLNQYQRSLRARPRRPQRPWEGRDRDLPVPEDAEGFLVTGTAKDRHGDFEEGAYLYGDTLSGQEAIGDSGQDMDREEAILAAQGSESTIGRPDVFERLADDLDEYPGLDDEDRQQVQEDLDTIEHQVLMGSDAEEAVLEWRLRHIQQLAPDIAEVLFAEVAQMAESEGGPLSAAFRRL